MQPSPRPPMSRRKLGVPAGSGATPRSGARTHHPGVPPPPFSRISPVCASAGSFAAAKNAAPSDLSYMASSAGRGAFAIHLARAPSPR